MFFVLSLEYRAWGSPPYGFKSRVLGSTASFSVGSTAGLCSTPSPDPSFRRGFANDAAIYVSEPGDAAQVLHVCLLLKGDVILHGQVALRHNGYRIRVRQVRVFSACP